MITLSTSYIQVWERQEDTEEDIKAMADMKAAEAAALLAPDEPSTAGPMEQ